MMRGIRALPFLVAALVGAVVVGVRAGERTPDPEDVPLLAAVYAPRAEVVETHAMSWGETLDGVLARGSFPPRERADLIFALRQHVDPRRLRSGTEVEIRRWAADGTTRAVEIRLNADSLIRLDRGPVGWSSLVYETPIREDTVYLEGRIQDGRSLYQTIVEDEDSGLPRSEREALVVELAEIYGYKLDFFHDIHPGDGYRLVYAREARPDGTARSRRVLVAVVRNQGTDVVGVFFDPRGDGGDYFDEDGNSLHLMFRRYPLDFVRVTSSFSWRRYHPVLGVHRAHLGTDFGAHVGTPVKATADGTVRFAGRDGGYGYMIEVRHINGYSTRYAHLSRFRPGIRPGVRVKQGQIIAYSGATGLVNGPHLHYELRQHGRPLNPRRVTLPAAPSVPKERLPEYRELVAQRLTMLDRFATRPARMAAGADSSRAATN